MERGWSREEWYRNKVIMGQKKATKLYDVSMNKEGIMKDRVVLVKGNGGERNCREMVHWLFCPV